MLRKLMFVMLATAMSLMRGQATQLIYQYWIDSSESIISGPCTDSIGSFEVNTSSLPAGMHTVTFMVGDGGGLWSAPQSILFVKEKEKQNMTITSYQYWIDSSESIISGPCTDSNGSFEVNTSSLPAGMHTVTFMVGDGGGLWSAPQSILFVKEKEKQNKTITSCQYWFNSSETPLSTKQISLSESVITMSETISIPDSLIDKSPGCVRVVTDPNTGKSEIAYEQILNIRFMDSEGSWSPNDSYSFFVAANDPHINLSSVLVNPKALERVSNGWTTKGSTVNINSKAHYAGQSSSNRYFTLGDRRSTKWNSSLSQTVNNLPAGTYTVALTYRASVMADAKLKVNNQEVQLGSAGMSGGAVWQNAADGSPEREVNDGKGFGWDKAAIVVTTLGEPLVISVEASASESEQWVDVTDFTLSTDRMTTLTVDFAPSVDRNRIKETKISLTSEYSTTSIAVGDRNSYTISGLAADVPYKVKLLNKYGQPLWQNDVATVGIGGAKVTIDRLEPIVDANITVKSPESLNLDKSTEITWFDRDGNRLAQGHTLEGVVEGSTVSASLELNDSIGAIYRVPASVAAPFVVTDSTASRTIVLEAVPEETLTARVIAGDIPAFNAKVSVAALIDGRYKSVRNGQTDERGYVSMEVPADSCRVTVSYPGFMNKTIDIDAPTDLGNITLDRITGAIISLDIKESVAKLAGQSDEKYVWHGNFDNLKLTLTKQGESASPLDFTLQNQMLICESLKVGETVNISVHSIDGRYCDASTTATIAENLTAATEMLLKERGGINASYNSSANHDNTLILFDENGDYVAKAIFDKGNTCSLLHLPSGVYTAVAMGSSSYLSMINSMDMLSNCGMQADKDYVALQTSVIDERLTELVFPAIPRLEESSMLYTTDAASFTSNKSETIVGTYASYTIALELDPRLAPEVSDISLVIELPDGCDFIQNSSLVGSETAATYFEGNNVIFPLTAHNYRDKIRFCVLPTMADRHFVHAYMQFRLNGEQCIQPLGRLLLDAKELEITAPETVIAPDFYVSGTAIPNSSVDIYDGKELVGTSDVRADGKWYVNCTLQDPINYSTHTIHGEITTSNGSTIHTGTKTIKYDVQANRVESVDLIYQKQNFTFSFQEPCEKTRFYTYYPSRKDFTFQINFGDNNPTRLSNVYLNVLTTDGSKVPIKASYLKEKNCWVATGKFSSTAVPVNVSVSYDTPNKILLFDQDVFDSGFIMMGEIKASQDNFRQIKKDELELLDSVASSLRPLPSAEEILSYYSFDPNDYPVSLPDDVEALMLKYENASSDQEQSAILEDISDLINSKCTLTNDCLNDYSFFENASSETVIGLDDFEIKYINGLDNLPSFSDPGFKSSIIQSTQGHQIEEVLADSAQYFIDRFSGRGYCVKRMPLTLKSMGCKSSINSSDDIYSDFSMIGNISELLPFLENAISGEVELLKQDVLLRYRDYYKNFSPLKYSRLNQSLAKLEFAEGLKKIANKTSGIMTTAGIIKNMYDDTKEHDILKRDIDNIGKRAKLCNLSNEFDQLKPQFDDILTSDIIGRTGRNAVNIVFERAKPLAVTGGLWGYLGLGLATGIQHLGNNLYTEYQRSNNTSEIKKLFDQIPWDKCDPNNNPDDNPLSDPENEDEFPGKPLTALIDPSGYVYEAVSSNRLEGVTATIYELTTQTDIYGESSQSGAVWDAVSYSQVNPQITDEMGCYAWDVPYGQWQVRFTKPGYEPVSTKWLPVPPPQLDVNVPMVQNTPPSVKDAVGVESGITFTFDKYMVPTSVSDNLVSAFSKSTAMAVTGKVEVVNPEPNPISGEIFASKFRFVPDRNFTAGDTVVLIVDKGALSYAGMEMLDSFRANVPIQAKIKSIAIDSVLRLQVGETRIVEVSLLPASAAAGRELMLNNGSPAIASVPESAIVLDAYGRGRLEITGNLPGVSPIALSLDGGELVTEILVNVSIGVEKVATPTASIPSGSKVDIGSQVQLFCATPEAEIYYTTDGSCPCDETTRSLYTAPITISRDMTIKAMAEKEGYESSAISMFSYSIGSSSFSEIVMPSGNVKVERGVIHLTECAGTNCIIYNAEGKVCWTQKNIKGDMRIQLPRNHTYIVRLIHPDGHATSDHVMP